MKQPEKCPLCNQTDFKLETDSVWGNNTSVHRAFYHCESCDVFFQWPRLTLKEESQFYKDEFEKFMEGRSPKSDIDWSGPMIHVQSNITQRARREKYLNPYYKKAAASVKPAILEVGCSSGFMLFGLKELYQFDIYGVEPSGVFGKFLTDNDIKHFDSVEELIKNTPEQQFDLITNYFVLEHIQEPKDFITNLYQLLKPGGSLIMEIPNAMDPLRTLYETKAFKDFYWSLAHPWYFTPKSVEYLLKDICCLPKFKILTDQRYDLGNHIHWLLRGRPGGQNSLDHVFGADFSEAFKTKLVNSGHCDTLILVIEKKGEN